MSQHTKLSYTISEAVATTGISRSSLYELINNGDLKSIKVAGRRLIRAEDLQAMLENAGRAANDQ